MREIAAGRSDAGCTRWELRVKPRGTPSYARDGATGVDGQTADEYAAHLEDDLQSLLERVKTGIYRATPVRRAYIPKGR